jgi:hypothetical protein
MPTLKKKKNPYQTLLCLQTHDLVHKTWITSKKENKTIIKVNHLLTNQMLKDKIKKITNIN